MQYYKVKPRFDGHLYGPGWRFVANELYTPGELKTVHKKYFSYYKNPLNWDDIFTPVTIKKTETYWFFGARFSNLDGAAPWDNKGGVTND